jgi:hypothetical protein
MATEANRNTDCHRTQSYDSQPRLSQAAASPRTPVTHPMGAAEVKGEIVDAGGSRSPVPTGLISLAGSAPHVGWPPAPALVQLAK